MSGRYEQLDPAVSCGAEKIIKKKSCLKTPKTHTLLPCSPTAVPQLLPSPSSCVLLTPLSFHNSCVSPQMSFSSALPHTARCLSCPQLPRASQALAPFWDSHSPAFPPYSCSSCWCSAGSVGTICPKEKAAEALMLFLLYMSMKFE